MTQPTSRNRYFFQLYGVGAGSMAGRIITASGGKVYVSKPADAQKATITDLSGTALTNPRSLTQGGCEFYSTETSVDLYIQAPKGQWVVVKGVKPGQVDIAVDVGQRQQVYAVPFAIADTVANTETDTGFDLPASSLVQHTPAILVTTLDAGQTIDVGLLSGEAGGDADGFIAALSVATAVLIKATVVNGGDKLGALLKVQDSANAGDDFPEASTITGTAAVSISYTLNAGTDTAEGIMILHVVLCGDLE